MYRIVVNLSDRYKCIECEDFNDVLGKLVTQRRIDNGIIQSYIIPKDANIVYIQSDETGEWRNIRV